MAYIDIDYYKNTFVGSDPDDDTLLQKLINRASDQIDMKARYSIDTDEWHSMQEKFIKKATAAQVEFLVENGEVYNNSGSPESASLGKFSIGGGGGGNTPSGTSEILCSQALAYFEQSGYQGRMVTVLTAYNNRDYDDD